MAIKSRTVAGGNCAAVSAALAGGTPLTARIPATTRNDERIPGLLGLNVTRLMPGTSAVKDEKHRHHPFAQGVTRLRIEIHQCAHWFVRIRHEERKSRPSAPGRRRGESQEFLMPDVLSRDQRSLIYAYWRAANYLSVGQIYLYDNPLLKQSLTKEHI